MGVNPLFNLWCKMKLDLKDKIVELIEVPLKEIGVEIADLNLSQYKTETTMKLFIYSSKGVTLDYCAKVSRAVGDILEETEFFEDGYLLEVSSPGLDRPLTKLVDFKYRIGEKIKLEFVDKKRKKITAEVIAVDGENITFQEKENTVSVPMTEINNGKIIF